MRLSGMMLVVFALAGVMAQGGPGTTTAAQRAGLSGPVAHVLTEEEGEDVARRARSEARYDEAGQLQELVSYAYDFRDGSLRSRSVTTYDGGRQLLRETTDAAGDVIATTLYRYDGHDRLIEVITYDASGAVSARQTSAYDAAGRLVRHEEHRGAGLIRAQDLTYRDDGTPHTHELYDGDGTLLWARAYAYGGLSYEELDYDDDGAVERRSAVRLDERGEVVEVLEFDEDGAVVERATYTYDERGVLVEDRWETDLTGRPSQYVTEYAYEFDDRGSWTIRRTIEFGEIVSTLFRTISYR